MSRIRLTIGKDPDSDSRSESPVVQLPDGRPIPVPVLRPLAMISIDGDLTPAIVDTGSPISFFPKGTWEKYDSNLGGSGAVKVYPGLHKVPVRSLQPFSVAGRVHRCLSGIVRLTVGDLDGRSLPEIEVMAYFQSPDDAESGRKTPILGIWKGALEGRYLVLGFHEDPSRGGFWLSDSRPFEPMVLARAVL